MANRQHHTMTGLDLHVAGYIQASDPGAVGAGLFWVDTTNTPNTLKKRNAGNSGWDAVGADAALHYLVTQTEAGLPNSTVAAKNTDGSTATWTDNAQYVGALAIQQALLSIAGGYNPHTACKVATTGALAAGTYNNGTAGVGATFTVTATGIQTVDGHALVLNDRVLVKNQADQTQNGVYVTSVAGAVGVSLVLTRDTDSDSGSELLNAAYAIETGTANTGTQWYCSNTSAPTIGTDAITFAQIVAPTPGGGPPGNTFNAPLSKSGNAVSMGNIAGLTAKTTPVDADLIVEADSAASFVAKKVTMANLKTYMAVPAAANPTGTIGATAVNGSAGTFMRSDGAPPLAIASLTGKTTPTGADTLVLADSAASSALKSLTFTNLKTYLDTLYAALSAVSQLTYRTISGTTDAPTATDAGKCLRTTSGSATTITFDVTLFSVGDSGLIRQVGAGQVTVAQTGGSIISAGALVKTRVQYSEISWSIDAANTLLLAGDLA